MAKIRWICGKICCGKSTYAQQLRLEHKSALLSVDEITLALFHEDMGEMHDVYAARAKTYLLEKAAELVECGVDVLLDWGFWTRAERDGLRAFCASRGIACEMHYMDVGDAAWRARLAKRNSADGGGVYFVDDGLAEKCAALFETPLKDEVDVRVS